MSRQMKHFADYFMQGMQLGGQWAEKWEGRRIAAERNKLKSQQDAIREAREERKLAIYGQGVAANAEAAKARAYRIMNPIAKGGGAGGGAVDPEVAALENRALQRGVIANQSPSSGQAAGRSGALRSDDSDGTEGVEAGVPDPPATEPVPEVQVERRGGMVRKMAGGGSIEEGANMSIGQAMSYGSKPKAAAGGGGGGIGGALAAGIAKGAASKGKDTITEEGAVGKNKPTPAVTPRGPMGSGVAGSYTEADSQPGGVLDTGIYRGGGRVRRFEGGGLNDDSDHVIQSKTGAPSTHLKLGKGSALIGANYDPNGKYIQGEVGYEHPVGNNLKLGVQGDYGKYIGPGGNEAKPDWGVGIRGKLKFDQGGTVRRFQNGGRVMEAIDTGTSGPGSGYGYRAAPPARR